jgi:hypothetical protein
MDGIYYFRIIIVLRQGEHAGELIPDGRIRLLGQIQELTLLQVLLALIADLQDR